MDRKGIAGLPASSRASSSKRAGESGHPLGFALDVFQRAPVFIGGALFAKHQFRGGTNESHRRAQLMRCVGRELVNPSDRFLQAGEKIIPGFGQPLDLVTGARYGKALGETGQADGSGRLR